MPTAAGSQADSTPVLVDTGALRIEELRGPDQLPDNKKLQGYGDAAGDRTLQPTTGDQVVFRVKEVGSNSDAAPQLAVLGSPQVPVGVSSALGYLHLGQVARVKLPPHLMEQTVTDTGGTMQDVDSSVGTAAAAGKPTQSAQHSSSTSQAQDRDEHQKDQQTKAHQHTQQQQQGGERPVASHPIDVVGAAQHGAVPVHTSGSSPSERRRHKLLSHRHHTEDTPPASPVTQPGHSRQYSDPVIIRPKAWREKQHQLQLGDGAAVSPGATTTSTTTTTTSAAISPAAAAGGTAPRTSRVAAAAAHAAAARSDDPIRRAVAASMAGGSGGSASTRQSPLTASTASSQAGSKTTAATQYGALSAPIVTGSSTSAQAAAVSSTNPTPGHSAAAAGGMRPSPSPAVLPASPAVSGTGGGRPPLGDSPGTWSSSSTVGTPGSAAMVAGSGGARSVSPALMRPAEPMNRSPSPGPSRGMMYSGYTRTDRTPTPGRTRSGSGPLQGVTFAKMSPQHSTEGPLPATPHPSPAVDSVLTASAGTADQQGGGVKALVSRLNQQRAQEAASAGGSRRVSADGASAAASPTALGGVQTRAMSPPAAVAGARRVSADTAASPTSAKGRRISADSGSSSSHTGFVTPPAAGGTPFFTPGSNTPQSSGSDANSTVTGGSTISSNSNISMSSVNQAGSRQGPPPRSLMTLEGLRSPGATTTTATATAPTAASADAMFGAANGAASASSVTGSSNAAGAVSARSPRPAGLSALMPQQQQPGSASSTAASNRTESADTAAATGSTAARAGDSTARQLDFDSRDRATDAATERGGVQPQAGGRAAHTDSTSVLQAAADKLRNVFGMETADAAEGPSSTAAKQGASGSSSGREQRQPGGIDVSVLRDAAGNIRATDSGESQGGGQDKGNVTFSRWLPAGGGSSSMMAAADARKSGSSDSAAGSSGSSIYRSREAAAMAAALQPGFNNSTGASSGVTATISTVDESEGEGVNLQNYPAARHKVESFGSVGADVSTGARLPAVTAAAAATPAATGAPAQGFGSQVAPVSADAAEKTGAGVGMSPAVDTQPVAATAAAPAIVSPSKAAAAAALASFGAVEAGAPAVVAVDTSGLANSLKGGVPSPAPPPVLQLYTKTGAGQRPSAAAGAVQGSAGAGNNRGTAVYMRPVEEALMPGRSTSSSFTGQKSSGSSFTAQQGSSATAAHGTSAFAASAGSAEAGNAFGKDRTRPTTGANGAVTAAGAGAGEGSGAQHAPGTAGAGGTDGAGGDGRVEYEVEVLGVVPGHGTMSGQPVLSEIAQQEHITPQDVRQAAAELATTEPHLKPPKPAKGCGSWVRRHLSLNVDAPRRAAKKGGKATGLRGCFGGGKKKQK